MNWKGLQGQGPLGLIILKTTTKGHKITTKCNNIYTIKKPQGKTKQQERQKTIKRTEKNPKKSKQPPTATKQRLKMIKKSLKDHKAGKTKGYDVTKMQNDTTN